MENKNHSYMNYRDFRILERQFNNQLERYGEKKAGKRKVKVSISPAKRRLKNKLRSFAISTSKKAFFITSMPFYWFIFFKSVVGWFDIGFFVFVIACSIIISSLKLDWGLLNWGLR